MGVCVSFNQHSSFVKSLDIHQGREKQTSGCVWLASERRVPAVFTPSAASPDDSASAVRRLHNGAARWGHGDRVTRGGGPVQHGHLPDHIAFSDGPLLLRASSHKHFINWDGLFCQYPRGSRSYFGAKISKHSRLRGRGHEMESSQAVWYVPAGDLSCKEGLFMTFKPQQINRGFGLAAFTDLKRQTFVSLLTCCCCFANCKSETDLVCLMFGCVATVLCDISLKGMRRIFQDPPLMQILNCLKKL